MTAAQKAQPDKVFERKVDFTRGGIPNQWFCIVFHFHGDGLVLFRMIFMVRPPGQARYHHPLFYYKLFNDCPRQVRQSDRNIAYGMCPRPSSPNTNNDTESRLSGKSNCYYHGTAKVPEFTSIVHRVEVHKRNNQDYLYQSNDEGGGNLQGKEGLNDQGEHGGTKSQWNIDEEEQEMVRRKERDRQKG